MDHFGIGEWFLLAQCLPSSFLLLALRLLLSEGTLIAQGLRYTTVASWQMDNATFRKWTCWVMLSHHEDRWTKALNPAFSPPSSVISTLSSLIEDQVTNWIVVVWSRGLLTSLSGISCVIIVNLAEFQIGPRLLRRFGKDSTSKFGLRAQVCHLEVWNQFHAKERRLQRY